MTNARLMMIMLSLVSMGTVVTSCDKNPEEDAASAQQNMPAPTVNVMPISLQTIPLTQELPGRTVAYQQADVRPQATGVIQQILYNEGGMVSEGQPLYRLSIDNYESAALANQAAVNQANANVRNAEASRDTALANQASQEALLEQARADVQRLEPLLEMHAISRQQYEQAITQYRTTEAALASTQAAVAQAQSSIQSANAALESAKARFNASNIDLSRTIVTAPISGVTGLSNVTVGALVNANQPDPLVSISKINPIYVDFTQSSSELLNLKRQQASGEIQPGSGIVELVLEDGSTYPIRGQLLLGEARVDEATGSVTMRAVFENDDFLLLPGMYVNVKMTKGVLSNAALLPQSAINRTPRGDTLVNVIDANNTVQARPVTLAGTYQDKWIVTDGLQAGEQVVIIGGTRLQPGQQVNVQPLPDTTNSDTSMTGGLIAPPSPNSPNSPSSDSFNPNTGNLGAVNSDTINPSTTNPSSTNPSSTNSDTANPDATSPDATSPDATNPDTLNSDTLNNGTVTGADNGVVGSASNDMINDTDVLDSDPLNRNDGLNSNDTLNNSDTFSSADMINSADAVDDNAPTLPEATVAQ